MRTALLLVGLWGCGGEILPVEIPGPEFLVDVPFIPGAMWSVREGPVTPIAVGGSPDPVLLERDRTVWIPREAPADWRGPIRDAFTSDGELWLVGDAGQIARGSIRSFQTVTSTPARRLHAISGFAERSVVAAGDALLLRDGLSWTASTAAGRDLRTVWGTGGTFFAGGAGGEILRIEGGEVAGMGTPSNERIRSLHGRSRTEVYAAGGETSGQVLALIEGAWMDISGPEMPPLHATYAGARYLWVSGEAGYLARWEGGAWEEVPTIATITLTALFEDDGDLLLTGGNVDTPTELGFVARYAEP